MSLINGKWYVFAHNKDIEELRYIGKMTDVNGNLFYIFEDEQHSFTLFTYQQLLTQLVQEEEE